MPHTPKKIVQVIRSLNMGKGGAERIFIETANFLSEMGHEVSCVHFGLGVDQAEIGLSETVSLINLAPQCDRVAAIYERLSKLRRLIRRLARVFGQLEPFQKVLWELIHGEFTRKLEEHFQLTNPEIIVSYLPPANTPVLLAAENCSARVICTNHNKPEADYNDPGRWDPNPRDRKLRLSALKRADAIHVLSAEFANWFPEELREKVVVIPNYVASEFTSSSTSTNRERLILTVGRLAPVKQLPVLIRAWHQIFSMHPGWKIEIVGDGPENGRLKDMVVELGLSETVLLTPFTRQIKDHYLKASILCHPARFEGFGLAVAEALSLKVPVIAFTDCSGVNHLVQTEHNGILVPRSAGRDGQDLLAQALSRLIQDDGLRFELAENGPASVSQYNTSTYKKNWSDLIERVCA